MFPLGTVLFPHAVLPLHVFEPRYRRLMDDVLAGEPEFGVVLIERGSEVGGGDTRFPVGTVARVARAAQLPDGGWALVTVGTRRIEVRRWLPDDPYPRAEVAERAEAEPPADVAALLAPAAALLRRVLALKAELGDAVPPAIVELDADPTRAAWQVAALAPVTAVDRQRLLDEDDHAARLRLVHALLEEEAGVLAHRLAGA
jgi:Lon protease-like protein